MMPLYPPTTSHEIYDSMELHKKIGQIIVMPPSDSDLQETGKSVTQVWFVTGDKMDQWYLLHEELP